MKPSQSVLVFKTLLVTFFVACTSFGQSSNRIIDLSKVRLSNKTSAIQAETRQGPGSGGGGNSCALMLKQNAIELIERVKAYPPFQKDGIADLLLANIPAAQFIPGENLEIAGKDVEAINYPTKKIIQIEHGFCDKISTFSIDSLGIALHEYLGLAGLDDDGYSVSSPFVDSIYIVERNKTSTSPYFADHQINNLRTKFEKSDLLTDDELKMKKINLSCTYYGETGGNNVQQTFTLQGSPDQHLTMQTARETITLKVEKTLGGLMMSPSKNSTSTSFVVLRQLTPKIFIAESSILGNSELDAVRLRTGPYLVPSTSVAGAQATGYSLCLPKDK